MNDPDAGVPKLQGHLRVLWVGGRFEGLLHLGDQVAEKIQDSFIALICGFGLTHLGTDCAMRHQAPLRESPLAREGWGQM